MPWDPTKCCHMRAHIPSPRGTRISNESVVGRLLFYVIENDDRHRDVACLQFQPQLLFERGKEGDAAAWVWRLWLAVGSSRRSLGPQHVGTAEAAREVIGTLD